MFGLCFGFGYGLTQRLTRMGASSPSTEAVPSFSALDTPGTHLGELQKRFGAEGHSLLGDLDQLGEERRQVRQLQEEESRKANQEQINQERQDAAQREADRVRLEALNHGPEPAAPSPEPILLPPQEPAPSQAPDPGTTNPPASDANPP